MPSCYQQKLLNYLNSNENKLKQKEPVKCSGDIWSPCAPVVVSCSVCTQVARELPVSCRTSCLETVYSCLEYFPSLVQQFGITPSEDCILYSRLRLSLSVC